jgi:hypothetical protein
MKTSKLRDRHMTKLEELGYIHNVSRGKNIETRWVLN